MCLITPNKEKKIAEEDMIVYKALMPDARSVLQGFLYELNKLYETEIEESDDWCAADSYAINALNEADYNYGTSRSDDRLISIGEGFHSCKTIERAEEMKDPNERIFSCTIPKGSEYYEDLSDLLVSNKIIINEEV